MSEGIQRTECYYLYFGLIVTGKGEYEHITKLFHPLVERHICQFEVIRFVGQRSPITSTKRELKMVGSGKTIPDKDASEIGFPARNYLSSSKCHFVILLDDLEKDRRSMAGQVFEKYRRIFDTILDDEQKKRASVHFLVNMLEAYYFAHTDAINTALNLDSVFSNYEGDVEDISHPKSDIKHMCNQSGYSFDERRDAGLILDLIDTHYVLSNPNTCAYLRTLFAWCVKVLETRYPYYDSLDIADQFCLANGVLSDVTRGQIHALTI